jgi:hypothetical protein
MDRSLFGGLSTPALPAGALLVLLLAAGPLEAQYQSIRLWNGGHFRVPDHPDFLPSEGLTIQAWVRPETSGAFQTIAGKNWMRSYWLGLNPSGRVRFYTRGNGTQLDGAEEVPLGRWTHVTVTYDGTRRRYYLNGELDFESTLYSGPLVHDPAFLGIGADVTGFPFTGMLDEVRFWRRALSAEEVRASISPERVSSSGLVSRWTCEQSLSKPALNRRALSTTRHLVRVSVSMSLRGEIPSACAGGP